MYILYIGRDIDEAYVSSIAGLNFVKIFYQTLSIKKRIKFENVSFIFWWIKLINHNELDWKKRVYITIVIVLSEGEKNWVERDTMRGEEVVDIDYHN